MTSKEALIELYNTSDYNKGQLKLCEIIEKDLEILDILKPSLKRGLLIEKIDLTKEENKIYKGYLPKDYVKDYIYKWCYCYDTWNVFKNEENAIKLKEWLDK